MTLRRRTFGIMAALTVGRCQSVCVGKAAL